MITEDERFGDFLDEEGVFNRDEDDDEYFIVISHFFLRERYLRRSSEVGFLFR